MKNNRVPRMEKAGSDSRERALFGGLLVCLGLGVLLLFVLCLRGSWSAATQGAVNQLADREQGNWLSIYGKSYFGFFLQATLLLAAGCSGLGVVLLPLLFMVYGGAFFYEILSFYQLAGMEGLVQYWQMFWVPALGKLILLCLVGSQAFRAAVYLAREMTGKTKADPGRHPFKPAVLRYLACLLAQAPVAAAAVLLGLLFL